MDTNQGNEIKEQGQAEAGLTVSAEIMALVEAWKSGETVWSVEMGGLGPGYEQAIQILIFELVSDMMGRPLPKADPDTGRFSFDAWGDETIKRLDDECGGFSGAQVGAARGVAFQFLKYGYKEMMDKAPQDRKIQVSKHFPSLSQSLPAPEVAP